MMSEPKTFESSPLTNNLATKLMLELVEMENPIPTILVLHKKYQFHSLEVTRWKDNEEILDVKP